MKLSFVFPCLNEEETLQFCIDELKNALKDETFDWEIIVADNGSTDNSIKIAQASGAKVVNVSKKGYGSALQGGFSAAEGEYIAFADSDGSYILPHVVQMLQAAENTQADMVIASRMKGKIEAGAMPFLHRYLGTPVLTFFINILHGGKMSDCNSGMRLFKKSTYLQWNPKSPGMEFASELLIQTLKHRSKVVEIPSGLRKDMRSRPPYLKTWRDGMRHLLFIFSEKPQFFEYMGAFLFFTCTILQLLAFFTGPIELANITIFDIHSKLLFLIFGSFGVQFYIFSCSQYLVKHTPALTITKRFIGVDDAKLFFILLLTGLATIGSLLWIALTWSQSGFSQLNISSMLFLLTHCLIVLGGLTIGLLGVHLLKRAFIQNS